MPRIRTSFEVTEELNSWIEEMIARGCFHSHGHATKMGLSLLKKIQEEKPEIFEWFYSA